MYVVHRHRIAASIATALAVILTLGLWLPGSGPAGRERPARRTARSGWSARSVGSAVWTVPDQEITTTTPGAGRGDTGSRHEAPPGVLVTPPGVYPPVASSVLFVPELPLLLQLASLGPPRGRAPPSPLA